MLSRLGGSVADWLSSDPSFQERFAVALLFWGLTGILFEYLVFDKWSGLLGPLLESAIIAVLLPLISRWIKNRRSASRHSPAPNRERR
jgi:hypothetical protein